MSLAFRVSPCYNFCTTIPQQLSVFSGVGHCVLGNPTTAGLRYTLCVGRGLASYWCGRVAAVKRRQLLLRSEREIEILAE